MHEKYKSCIKVIDLLEGAVAARVQQKFASVRGGGRGDQLEVEIVWSPSYEADADLVQLCSDGRCAAVITADSGGKQGLERARQNRPGFDLSKE